MGEPTDADIIGQYIKIRDFLDKKTAEFETSLEPYKKAMTALEGVMSQRLMDQNTQSVKTECGTAYRSSILSPKVADKDVLLDWVFEGKKYSFLTSAVSKEAVKEHMDAHKTIVNGKEELGPPPPGVSVTWIFKTNFRRPS